MKSFEIYDCVEWDGRIGSINVWDIDYDGTCFRVDFPDGSCKWFNVLSAWNLGLRKRSKIMYAWDYLRSKG
jgi:hypothetical protein